MPVPEEARAEPGPAPEEALLQEFNRHEEHALSLARARLADIEKKLAELLRSHPERLRAQMSDLQRRIKHAQSECDRHVAQLRAGLPGGGVSVEEIRAHLVMLDMEYASRCRTAEHGIQLLAEELRDYLQGVSSSISSLLERLRELVESQGPWRTRLDEILRIQGDRSKRAESRLGRAVAILGKARKRLQALSAQRRSGRWADEAVKKALAGLEAKVRDLEERTADQRAELDNREAVGRGLAESLERERSLREREAGEARHELDALRANIASLEQRLASSDHLMAGFKPRLEEAQQRLADAEYARDDALKTAQALRAEVSGLKAEVAELERSATSAEAERASAVERLETISERALADAERSLGEELASAREAVSAYKARLDAAEEASASASARAAGLEQRLARAEAESAGLAERVREAGGAAQAAAGASAEAERAREKLQEAMAERDTCRARAEESERALAGLLAEVAALRAKASGEGGGAPDPEKAHAAAITQDMLAQLKAQADQYWEDLQRVVAERDAARASVREAEAGWRAAQAEAAELRNRLELSQLERERVQPQADSGISKLEERLQESLADRDQAREKARESEAALADILARMRKAEEDYVEGAGGPEFVGRAGGPGEAGTVARLAMEGLARLLAVLADCHERLILKEREASALRKELELDRESWEKTMANQDASRLEEIFTLKAQVHRLQQLVKDKPAG